MAVRLLRKPGCQVRRPALARDRLRGDAAHGDGHLRAAAALLPRARRVQRDLAAGGEVIFMPPCLCCMEHH